MRRIVFFDTETTGLPINYKAPVNDLKNWPRIIQLAIAVYLESETVGVQKVKSKEFLIKPDGWEIPKQKFWIDNGFSTEKSEAEGVPLIEALNFFKQQIQGADLLVAHNMNFDSNILGAEMIREGFSTGQKIEKFCTMMATIDYCRIPFPNGGNGFKFPQLKELHQILFEEDFEGAHQASSDAEACAKCYFELVKRGLI